MNALDRNKVRHAGFRIFRQRRVYPIEGSGKVLNSIWELSDTGSWCKYQEYESKAALTWAIEEGYIEKKSRIKMFRIAADETPRVLEPDQIKTILRKAFKTDRDMGRRLFFHLWTGTRRTEGCRLTWPDMDFRKTEIRVQGKGGKARLVPMLTPVAKMLLPIKKDIGRVFNDLHPDTVSHAFQKIAQDCEIKARLHDLRHTCATYLLKSGVSLDVVQKILGHVHISTTQIYAQVLDEIKKREMAKLRFE